MNAPPPTPPRASPWFENLGPAVVVTLISVPLSMGIAIASGVPAARGLVTGIVGGLLIGSLTSCRLQISGPSAGQAVMVLELVNQFGVRSLGVVVPLVGLLQTLAGFLKLGKVFRAVSPAVINGMLAGIGLLLFAAQFHVMVDDPPRGSGLQNLLGIPDAVRRAMGFDGSVHTHAAGIGALTLLVLVVMAWLKAPWLKRVPAPLVAVVVGTGTAAAFGFSILRVDMPDSVLESFAPPSLADLHMLRDPSLWLSALALTFVASAETLLCSSAVDAMHDGPRTDYDRELLAQGLGNVVCGALGALPTTGVITRSGANVQAGATGRQSAILVGAGLLAFMVVLPGLLEVVPTACLAGILVFIGYQLVRGRPYAELLRYGWSELFVYFVTVGVIVSVNLLSGILVGIGLALVKLVISRGKSFHEFEVEVQHDREHAQVHVHLSGAASFIHLARLSGVLEALPPDEVHLHIEHLEYIDHACLDVISKWERQRIRAHNPVRVEWDYLHHTYYTQNLLIPTPEEHVEVPEHTHSLLDFLYPEVIYLDEPYADKADAIDTLGRHLVRHYRLEVDGNALIDSIHARERRSSTCVGGGLMIPHGVLRSRQGLHGALAISREGWNFETPDGLPVRCILLLATPQDSAAHHLAVLAAFARLFEKKPELREQILAAGSPQEVVALLSSEDAAEINYSFDRLSAAQAEALPRPATA
ncbi:MAG: PTS sugar transporter subunit IIA, partial [Planctomycetes bacterium]|nr:PTS sugar transporter subunit IIA [Planctomycetota bacterium]